MFNSNVDSGSCLAAVVFYPQGFPHFQEFTVVHDYLVTPSRKMQARLRRRGQEGQRGVYACHHDIMSLGHVLIIRM